jgi:hypothetical protein
MKKRNFQCQFAALPQQHSSLPRWLPVMKRRQ